MLLGYLIMVLLTLLVSLYAIGSLKRLRSMSNQMVQIDLPRFESTSRLLDILLAQDRYERRYQILRDPILASRFWDLAVEFDGLSRTTDVSLDGPYQRYARLFRRQVGLFENGRVVAAERLAEGETRRLLGQLVEKLQSETERLKTDQNEKVKVADEVTQRSFQMMLLLCTISIVFGVSFAILITYSLSSSIQQFKAATQMIGRGLYDQVPTIRGAGDVGDLAESFRWMTRRLKELEEIHLDASPLTRMPGNLAIEKEVLTRLSGNQKFAFCHLDIDNFKAFGDKYGYARGSEVLKQVAKILADTVKQEGAADDFIGHIGGDDFVLITEPGRMHRMCQRVIKVFDETIGRFYDEDDRMRGYIIARDRRDMEQLYPIMTISIAVVTNERREIHTPMQLAEVAAQLKQYAKTFPKSIYVVDQRRNA